MGIYAALKVPEVWRLDQGVLSFHVLGKDNAYVSTASALFPGLTPTDLPPFLALRDRMDENALIREFRPWVQQQITARWR